MSSLTSDSIHERLGESARSRLDVLEVFSELESTNTYLLGQPCPMPGRYRVALAKHQTNGRGRMNRRWISPPSSGLCLSMSFTFARLPEDFASLSLAIGTGIVQALEKLGARGIAIKWPNDLVAGDGKLGGILPEVHSAKANGMSVVVGIGLNVDLRNGTTEKRIGSSLGRAVDLASCSDKLPSRPVIAAALIESLVDSMLRFETGGFSLFHDAWQQYDWLRGREVIIERADARDAGIADGVDTDGALLLNAGGTRRRITSGSVIVNGPPGTQP